VLINDRIFLEQLDHSHAAKLLETVNANRHHLREWLPWVDNMLTVANFEKYIEQSEKRTADGQEIGYVIMEGEEIIGRIGIYNIDPQHKNCSFGYWLSTSHEGKGIITQSCKKLFYYCFGELEMNRIEIRCGVGNEKSAAIPKRLGFKKEGVLKQAEFVNTRFIDLEVFALLKEEWEAIENK
jgi:ribosomal-protein-serine acetyltransferase